MNGVFDAEILETERQSFRAVEAFVLVVTYSALFILMIYTIFRLMEHGFAWPGVLLTLACVATWGWLARICNRHLGIFRHLDRWEQSIQRRQSILNAAKDLPYHA